MTSSGSAIGVDQDGRIAQMAVDPLIEEITSCRNGLRAARDTETEKGGKTDGKSE